LEQEYNPPSEAPDEWLRLPENLEAEQGVIGSIFLEPESFDEISDILRGHEFASEANRKIFSVLAELREDETPIDFITVLNLLTEKGWLHKAGGMSYLSSISGSAPTAANIKHYALIVQKVSIHRQAIQRTIELLDDMKGTSDPVEAIRKMQLTSDLLTEETSTKKEMRVISVIAMECFEDAEQRYFNRKDGRLVTGVSSGFDDIDRMTSGFQKSDLIIVAARPSVGKTAFALNIAQNVGVRVKETVAIFSCEMSEMQLVNRMICAEGNIDATRFRTGALNAEDWNRASNAVSVLGEANIYIDDTPAITVAEIRAKCRKMKKEKGLGLIIIDYLQLLAGRGKSENRQQEVSEITRTLKQVARELDIPIIALSQLSRGVEQRQDKRPMLSDLRDSGSIEQDADIVAFLYREDYYDANTEKKNIIEIIIAKQRNGPVGTVELAFLKNYSKFVSLDRGHHANQPEAEDEYKKPDMYAGR
jgi:replicative DNA helicase